MKILFDLDGTLINSKERLYKLFRHLVKRSTLTFDAYWELKRYKIGHVEILKRCFFYSDRQIVDFETAWLLEIEKKEWLAMDKPFEGVTDFLLNLKKENKLYLVSSRQFEQQAMEQITGFGWDGIFDHVFITGQKEEKAGAIIKILQTKKNDWIIGDTGNDVETGHQLGIQTAAVLTGFRNKEVLEKYHPTIILNSVLEFKTIIT